MRASRSRYYKLPVADGLEALDTSGHNTPFPAHFHPTFNISIIYNGIFQTRLNDRLLGAAPGTILVTNPGEIHANPCDRNDSLSFFTFYVSADFMQYCNGGRPVMFDDKSITDNDLFAGLHNLRLSLLSGDHALDFETRLIATLSQLAARHGADRSAEQQPYPLFDELLAEENVSKFSLEEAAGRFGLDKYKFLRLFKYQTGLTPNNYFILKRIEKSKILLAEGNDLLSVAIDLGFYDAAHFSNHFKKFTGVSPMGYTAK